MAPEYVIGSDLGTTNSALAYAPVSDEEPQIEILPIPQLVAAGTVEGRQDLAVEVPSEPFAEHRVGPNPADDRVQGVLVDRHLQALVAAEDQPGRRARPDLTTTPDVEEARTECAGNHHQWWLFRRTPVTIELLQRRHQPAPAAARQQGRGTQQKASAIESGDGRFLLF